MHSSNPDSTTDHKEKFCFSYLWHQNSAPELYIPQECLSIKENCIRWTLLFQRIVKIHKLLHKHIKTCHWYFNDATWCTAAKCLNIVLRISTVITKHTQLLGHATRKLLPLAGSWMGEIPQQSPTTPPPQHNISVFFLKSLLIHSPKITFAL